ncbi:MAG: amidase family protein [Oscillospiraceae bacterium]|nr:amidase family protein [Oscillospiraceae bacterium]
MEIFTSEYQTERQAGVLYGVLEDSIMHKNQLVAAGSKIMDGFTSPIEATVVSRLEEAGIGILGKTCMDEFGIMGLYAKELNFTSGAVEVVATGVADFALCNDYTGYITSQAAAKGLYYLHPTYGTVSRYGLIPAVASIDQIGIVCKEVEVGFRVLSIISGYDSNDGAVLRELGIRNEEFAELGIRSEELGVGELTVAVPRNLDTGSVDVSELEFLHQHYNTVDIELPYFEVYGQIMQILCFGEISCNISRYDGISFGYRASDFSDLDDLYKKSRTEALGEGAKLAALIGSMVLSEEYYEKYYEKAMCVRRLVKESLEFDKYDGIIMPACPVMATIPWQLELHALPRLCGLPALTIPNEVGGYTIIANAGREDRLNKIVEKILL